MADSTKPLLHAFKRLIHVLTTGKAKTFRCGDVTLYRAEAHILEIVGNQPGISATDIVRQMGVTKGAVSQIIAKLRRKGLLRQEFDAGNMKVRRLYASDTGLEVLQAHQKAEESVVRQVLAELQSCGEGEVAAFTRVVNAVTDFAKG